VLVIRNSISMMGMLKKSSWNAKSTIISDFSTPFDIDLQLNARHQCHFNWISLGHDQWINYGLLIVSTVHLTML